MALVTLQTIFQDAFPAYEQRHALPAHVRRAAHALMQCRTAALGGHVQACPDGHVVPHLVQLVSAPVLSAVCVSPDRALAGPATGAAPGV